MALNGREVGDIVFPVMTATGPSSGQAVQHCGQSRRLQVRPYGGESLLHPLQGAQALRITGLMPAEG